MRLVSQFPFFVAILFATGCGGGGGETTVTGSVKFKGKPLGNGYVLLKFDDNNEAKGDIAADGSYSIQSPFKGHAKIAVGSPKPHVPKADARNPNAAANAPDPAKWVEIPEKYASVDTSGKEMTVAAGKNKHDIDLE